MTRLTEEDVRWLPGGVAGLEERLARATGLDLVGVAARACDLERDDAAHRLTRIRVAVVPISAGQGFIAGFAESVAAICEHIGCHAWVTPHPDVAGLADAAEAGARLVFAADEERFIALDITSGACADNGEATGRAFLAALDAAAGGLRGKEVLVLGLGPVGRAAAARAVALGATALAVDPDSVRLEQVSGELGLQPVDFSEGLARCRLVLDAAPVGGLIPAEWVTPVSIVSAPGMPPAAGPETAEALGERHVHEPLALGVVTMALEALL
jgi:pyrrolysine biosynthesis protein PylD